MQLLPRPVREYVHADDSWGNWAALNGTVTKWIGSLPVYTHTYRVSYIRGAGYVYCAVVHAHVQGKTRKSKISFADDGRKR
jgi:hypothetical protein